MKQTLYPAVFSPDGKYWCVEFVGLPGCLTQGKDLDEAYYAAQEALALYLASIDSMPKVPNIMEIDVPEGSLAMLIEPHSEYPIIKAKNVDIVKLLEKSIAESGYTKYRISKILDLSESYINLICSGKRQPSPKVAQKIGALLQLDWQLFYGEYS